MQKGVKGRLKFVKMGLKGFQGLGVEGEGEISMKLYWMKCHWMIFFDEFDENAWRGKEKKIKEKTKKKGKEEKKKGESMVVF